MYYLNYSLLLSKIALKRASDSYIITSLDIPSVLMVFKHLMFTVSAFIIKTDLNFKMDS